MKRVKRMVSFKTLYAYRDGYKGGAYFISGCGIYRTGLVYGDEGQVAVAHNLYTGSVQHFNDDTLVRRIKRRDLRKEIERITEIL